MLMLSCLVTLFFLHHFISFCRPAQYDLQGKFLAGRTPRKSAFPKGGQMKDRNAQGPGPGSYQPIMSMGKQVLSTKTGSVQLVFPKGESNINMMILYVTHISCINRLHVAGAVCGTSCAYMYFVALFFLDVSQPSDPRWLCPAPQTWDPGNITLRPQPVIRRSCPTDPPAPPSSLERAIGLAAIPPSLTSVSPRPGKCMQNAAILCGQLYRAKPHDIFLLQPMMLFGVLFTIFESHDWDIFFNLVCMIECRPGAYVLPGGVATVAKGSPYRNSPQVTLSGRNKFGSPW